MAASRIDLRGEPVDRECFRGFSGFRGDAGTVCERTLVRVTASLFAVVVTAKRIQASAVRDKGKGENESLDHRTR